MMSGKLAPVVRRRRGRPLTLRCEFRGVPAASVHWLKNARQISTTTAGQQTGRVRVSTTVYSSVNHDDDDDDDDDDLWVISRSELLIEHCRVRDSGMYQCQASNVAGVAVMTTSVDIVSTGLSQHQL